MPVTAITGPMKCGKSEEGRERVKRYSISKKRILVFFLEDCERNQRNLEDMLKVLGVTGSIQIETVNSSEEMARIAGESDPDVILIEEAHFIGTDRKKDAAPKDSFINYSEEEKTEIRSFLLFLEEFGCRRKKAVFVIGLDTDFLHEPFGVMPFVLAIADVVVKLAAVCDRCREIDIATRSQRVDARGRPESRNSPRVEVGSEKYPVVCLNCWQPPENGDEKLVQPGSA